MTGRRRIIVIFDPLLPETQQRLVDWLNSHGAGWARWVSGGLLIAPKDARPSVKDLQGWFLEISPGTQFMAFEIAETGGWAGRMNTDLLNRVTEWLKTQWGLESTVSIDPPQLPPPRKPGA